MTPHTVPRLPDGRAGTLPSPPRDDSGDFLAAEDRTDLVAVEAAP